MCCHDLSGRLALVDHSEHPAYGNLVRTHADPGPHLLIHPPRPALVTTDLYDGRILTLELAVIARTRMHVCVRQERAGHAPWDAWVPSDRVRYSD